MLIFVLAFVVVVVEAIVSVSAGERVERGDAASVRVVVGRTVVVLGSGTVYRMVRMVPEQKLELKYEGFNNKFLLEAEEEDTLLFVVLLFCEFMTTKEMGIPYCVRHTIKVRNNCCWTIQLLVIPLPAPPNPIPDEELAAAAVAAVIIVSSCRILGSSINTIKLRGAPPSSPLPVGFVAYCCSSSS